MNIDIPNELWDFIKIEADKRETSCTDMLRRFIKLGILACMIEGKESAALIIRDDDGTERELVLK